MWWLCGDGLVASVRLYWASPSVCAVGLTDAYDEFFLHEGPEGMDEPISTSAIVGKSEEPPGTELQRDTEASHLAPNHATFPKIHSRRFRE